MWRASESAISTYTVTGVAGGQHLEQLAHRRYRRLVAREHERRCVGRDRVAPTGSRDRGGVTRCGGDGPFRRRAPAVHHDFQVELERDGIDAARRERADRGATPIREQELVAVPRGHHDRTNARRREQEAHARRGKVDRETLELGAGQRDAQQPRAHVRRPLHLDAPKARRLAPDAERVRISVSAAHGEQVAIRTGKMNAVTHTRILVALTGLPATGKSAIADAIGRALPAPVFSVDPLEAVLNRAGITREHRSGHAAYDLAAMLAEAQLPRRPVRGGRRGERLRASCGRGGPTSRRAITRRSSPSRPSVPTARNTAGSSNTGRARSKASSTTSRGQRSRRAWRSTSHRPTRTSCWTRSSLSTPTSNEHSTASRT